jgi:hypothetical protein
MIQTPSVFLSCTLREDSNRKLANEEQAKQGWEQQTKRLTNMRAHTARIDKRIRRGRQGRRRRQQTIAEHTQKTPKKETKKAINVGVGLWEHW